MSVSILKVMLVVTAPAAFALWCSSWFFHMGTEGYVLGWILLILALPLTVLATLMAMALDGFLLVTLVALLFGRTGLYIRFHSQRDRFDRMRAAKRVYPVDQ